MSDNSNTISQNYLEIELLEDRTLFLDGEINIETTGKLVKQLLILQTRGKNKKQPIKLYINSQGGSIYDMLALYDVIRSSPCEVHTIVTGTAMSAAAFILMAGDKRYAYENSKIMFHEITDSFTNPIKISDLEVQQQENQNLMTRLYEIMATHTKIKICSTKTHPSALVVINSKDLYISSTTALDWGVIDYVIKNN